jgi:Rrf2 family protein
MLSLPQTAEYALRAVSFIAEHEAQGPVPVGAVAESLGAPRNYLSKILNQLGALGILRSVRGAHGGYLLGSPAGRIRLATIVEPYLAPSGNRCIMGRVRCRDDAPCGAHWRWKQVRDTTAAFFAELTVGDLLAASPPSHISPRKVAS